MNKAQWIEFLDLDLYDVDRKLSGLKIDEKEKLTEEQQSRKIELLKERLHITQTIGLIIDYRPKTGFTDFSDEEEIKLFNLTIEKERERN